MSGGVLPLPVLVSRVLGHLTAEVERDAGVGETLPSLAVWSNVVRLVGNSEGLAESDLPEAARISSRQATAAVKGSLRRGWITTEGSGKSRELLLTNVGCAAFDIWRSCLKALDKRWKKAGFRAPLESLVSQLELELPHFPVSYGAADPSANGAPFMQAKRTPKRDFVHGTNWKPVPRAEGDTVSSLPTTALLSQALMAFTIDYENKFPWPLNSTLTRLPHIDEKPKPLADLPEGHGVSGEGKSLLERHLIVEVTTDSKNKKMVALTDRGKQVKHHHPLRLETVQSEWQERYGGDLITALRDPLTPVATGEAASQPDHLMGRLHLG